MRTAHVRSGVIFLTGIFLLFSAYAATILISPQAYAETEIERLKNEINDRNNRLQEIEEEIATLQVALDKAGSEKSTLRNAINQLELERKKIQADINYTQNKIGATDLEINKLSIEISNTESSINDNEQALGEILRSINEADNDSLIEMLLLHENLSEFWSTVESLEQVRKVMSDHVKGLVSQKIQLENKYGDTRKKKEDLVELKGQYEGQQKILSINKAEKDDLLVKTQKKEEIYQDLLAESEAERERFEQELRELESQLQFILDPNTIPPPGTPVFAWPLDNVRVTQYFGDTAFSRSGAYNGRGHNGVDFGSASEPVRAALSGKVIAVNTQVAYMCQYGKWVLVKHANGLTSLYAHLSLVSVNQGDQVTTGQILGYSGDTGYATGKHLHFTVYASDAVTFKQYTCNSGITLTIPVSAVTGYINPMDYLPQL